MTDAIKGFREVLSIHYHILIGMKQVRNGLEEVNKGYCCRGTWLECELVGEAKVRRRKLKGWIYEVPDYDSLSNP
jgi:hypothetical protein